jgi:hypothetical protein
MIKMMQIIVNIMYPASLPIAANEMPNNPPASLMTNHSNGKMMTNMINARSTQNRVFRIPPIS